MKKAIILILSLIIVICGSAVTGCTKASTAVGRFDLIRENFAREKEAEEDAKGREHIEIPADAETIEIENETWTVVREAKKFQKATGNYILANDMVLSDLICFANDFEGKLNGNNYKIKNYNVGTIKRLFYSIENSTIENIIFTTIDGYGGYNNTNSEPLIATFAKNCVIKNCVSYYQQDANYYKKANKKNYTRYNGFVANVHDSIIEDCINYGDFYVGYGGIVTYAINSTIRNSVNSDIIKVLQFLFKTFIFVNFDLNIGLIFYVNIYRFRLLYFNLRCFTVDSRGSAVNGNTFYIVIFIQRYN